MSCYILYFNIISKVLSIKWYEVVCYIFEMSNLVLLPNFATDEANRQPSNHGCKILSPPASLFSQKLLISPEILIWH